MTETPERPVSPVPDTESFARVYGRHLPRLRNEARSLVEAQTSTSQPAKGRLSAGDRGMIDDLVAKSVFRVWRQLPTTGPETDLGHELSVAVRALAPWARTTAGRHVDLAADALERMPRRQVTALWLADAVGLPLAAVGGELRTNRNAMAVLLHRAREAVRQAYLLQQPGAPDDSSCLEHWKRMPEHIRGADTSAASAELARHVRDCEDCRERLGHLTRVSDGLFTVVGPALLSLVLQGRAPYLLPLAGAGAAEAGWDAAKAPSLGASMAPLRFVRRLADRAFGQANSNGRQGQSVGGARSDDGDLFTAAAEESQGFSRGRANNETDSGQQDRSSGAGD